MSGWPALQSAFAAAVADPGVPPPGEIGKTCGAPSNKRFNVYSNNVAVSLTGALSANFPVTTALIGEAAFATLARAYMADHAPKTPVLMEYGDEFSRFIARFNPLAELDFLPDVAALENAWNAAYNAADIAPAAVEGLAALPPDRLGTTRFDLHPATRVIRSQHPVVSIWFAHQGDDVRASLKNLPRSNQDALVTRPIADVEVRRLPPGAAVFAERLGAGDTLAASAELAAASDLDFNPEIAIGGMFESGAIANIK